MSVRCSVQFPNKGRRRWSSDHGSCENNGIVIIALKQQCLLKFGEIGGGAVGGLVGKGRNCGRGEA